MEDLMYYPELPADPTLFDPTCDPDNPVVVGIDAIKEAQGAIHDHIEVTPCQRSRLSEIFEMELYLKKEILHYTSNFKERGACFALLKIDPERKKKGVIAASAGNHAQALAFHGRNQNVHVKLVMPIIAPTTKVNRCKKLGAEVVLEGNDMAQAKNAAMRYAKEEGRVYVNGYDNPDVLAGAGTIGLEILEQVKGVSAIVIPVGGGGLFAGIAAAVKGVNPSVKVIGVESERCAGMCLSLKTGKLTTVAAGPSLADGLLVPTVGYNSFATARACNIYKMCEVHEQSIAISILRIMEEEKCVVEGAGATALAAVIEGQLNEFKGKKVAVILSGANIDTTVFARCLERGVAADGRLIKVVVTISDRPGGMRDLAAVLFETGVNIRDISQERAWVDRDVFSVEVSLILETKDKEHSSQVLTALKKSFKQVRTS